VRRPCGVTPDPDGEPRYAPSRALDIELEVGFVVGTPGTTIEPDAADRHVFGAVLLNDWSARDIQAYEYQPLGPHLGKSFATTISPWVVTLDALAPFLTAAPPQEPLPDPHLRAERPWALDAHLTVDLNGVRIAATGFASMYWTFAQQLAHMTANGAVARTGDLIGSGTVSGPGRHERGSLIELTWRGAEPITLNDGTTRSFLADGDEVTLRGWCGGTGGGPRVGFGECAGRIEPAREGNG
jgi:fumarylacetoacetase